MISSLNNFNYLVYVLEMEIENAFCKVLKLKLYVIIKKHSELINVNQTEYNDVKYKDIAQNWV
jgi:hypothetical protein